MVTLFILYGLWQSGFVNKRLPRKCQSSVLFGWRTMVEPGKQARAADAAGIYRLSVRRFWFSCTTRMMRLLWVRVFRNTRYLYIFWRKKKDSFCLEYSI